jgi:hypothetical protein
MRCRRSKSRRKESTKVVLIKQITDHDPRIVFMMREGAEGLARSGRVLSVLAEEGENKKQGFVQVFGTYHCVFDNEWGNTRYFKPARRFERLIEAFFEEE